MTHTPGKWEACEPGDYSDFDGQSRVVTGDDRRIAVVHYGGDLESRIECDANARLITSAPDLLEALNHPILYMLLGAIEDSGTAEASKLWALASQWIELRDAAIKKAFEA